jgi:hypothetical protein
MNAISLGFWFDVDYTDKPMIDGLRHITVKKKWGWIKNAAEGNAGRSGYGLRHRVCERMRQRGSM